MNADATTEEFMEHPFEDSPRNELMLLTLTELAYLAGTSRKTIEELLAWEIIVPSVQEPEPGFTIDVLPQVRKILRLHTALGVDFPSMGLVLGLLNRIAEFEKRLADLESGQKL